MSTQRKCECANELCSMMNIRLTEETQANANLREAFAKRVKDEPLNPWEEAALNEFFLLMASDVAEFINSAAKAKELEARRQAAGSFTAKLREFCLFESDSTLLA